MEAFISDNGEVAKFIHEDGSETAIKEGLSHSTFREDDGSLILALTDRNKYSVIISSSRGCYMSCPFCHLTIKNSTYAKLTKQGILENLKEALTHEVTRKPELKSRFIKICWMGMGDCVNQPQDVKDVTLAFVDWVLEKGYAAGLDGVDIATVLPRVKSDWIRIFTALNKSLSKYELNPDNLKVEQALFSTLREYPQRSTLRIFYSLHSAIQETREKLVPKATPLSAVIGQLQEFERNNPYSLVFHQLFVEDLNDSEEEVGAVIEWMQNYFPNSELRILRYNSCDRSPYHEWPAIDRAIATIASKLPLVKVQKSAGSEIQAACGQFLVAYPVQVKP